MRNKETLHEKKREAPESSTPSRKPSHAASKRPLQKRVGDEPPHTIANRGFAQKRNPER